jgi:L-alanine-DL-glutamate epimerase-like enolase superfamily enzyme
LEKHQVQSETRSPFPFPLYFARVVPDIGRYQECKLSMEKWRAWFDPPITVKNGLMNVPTDPGVGIKDPVGLLNGAKVV